MRRYAPSSCRRRTACWCWWRTQRSQAKPAVARQEVSQVATTTSKGRQRTSRQDLHTKRSHLEARSWQGRLARARPPALARSLRVVWWAALAANARREPDPCLQAPTEEQQHQQQRQRWRCRSRPRQSPTLPRSRTRLPTARPARQQSRRETGCWAAVAERSPLVELPLIGVARGRRRWSRSSSRCRRRTRFPLARSQS